MRAIAVVLGPRAVIRGRGVPLLCGTRDVPENQGTPGRHSVNRSPRLRMTSPHRSAPTAVPASHCAHAVPRWSRTREWEGASTECLPRAAVAIWSVTDSHVSPVRPCYECALWPVLSANGRYLLARLKVSEIGARGYVYGRHHGHSYHDRHRSGAAGHQVQIYAAASGARKAPVAGRCVPPGGARARWHGEIGRASCRERV